MNPKKLIFLFLFFANSCATRFEGSPLISKAECKVQCQEWNLNMGAMIAIGKYSTACVCQVSRGSGLADSGSIGAAITAVELQRRQDAAAAAAARMNSNLNNQHHHAPPPPPPPPPPPMP